ncbi:MAG: hypothetical protein ACOYMF_14635 [Bacteroidales bacterium]
MNSFEPIITGRGNRINYPTISLDKYKFHYNALLRKLADLEQYRFVTYSVNKEDRKIRFAFHCDHTTGAYSLARSNKKATFRSYSAVLINKYDWIRKTALQEDSISRRFIARQDSPNKPVWIISLIPCFEKVYDIAKLSDIPLDLSGIYRYRDSQDKVIYIGKGKIRTRIKEIGRLIDWDIKKIEISEIVDSKLQFEYENFWINKFKKENNDELPRYNRNQGIK